ncbi:MAG TPA: MerR family transcriptional regulator, partial [Salinimicrobium sp.]|nr:MerR family transcriptional regulator [Salinimicrobium sp.]
MDVWSISQISRFSGVKSHTIRIWEQRYNALRPGRSKGNTRRYDGSQLRRLLNIAGLMESGYKISELAGLTDQELFELTRNKQNDPVPNISDLYISQLVSAGL